MSVDPDRISSIVKFPERSDKNEFLHFFRYGEPLNVDSFLTDLMFENFSIKEKLFFLKS